MSDDLSRSTEKNMETPIIALNCWPTERNTRCGPCVYTGGRWYRLSRLRYHRWQAAGAIQADNEFLDREPIYLARSDFPGGSFN
jgi:hypothetical protein